jgi:hypothetical protein
MQQSVLFIEQSLVLTVNTFFHLGTLCNSLLLVFPFFFYPLYRFIKFLNAGVLVQLTDYLYVVSSLILRHLLFKSLHICIYILVKDMCRSFCSTAHRRHVPCIALTAIIIDCLIGNNVYCILTFHPFHII